MRKTLKLGTRKWKSVEFQRVKFLEILPKTMKWKKYVIIRTDGIKIRL
jgi:hypothetical protein